mmetsp:Transcript_45871/g.53038  ORF Transcript_45871/g.53038 Transcript_45871/m.53038 type:complete len:1282 (-) Transcript_45871:153-3998(-)
MKQSKIHVIRNHSIFKSSSLSSSPSSLSLSPAKGTTKTKRIVVSSPFSSNIRSIVIVRRLSWCHKNILPLLRRLLIPFFILISTTCCTTTTSLSTLGFYKVGTGSVNLVDNILGHGNSNGSGSGSGEGIVGKSCIDKNYIDSDSSSSSRSITNQNNNNRNNSIKSIKRNNKNKRSRNKGIRKEKSDHIPHKNKEKSNKKVGDTLSQKGSLKKKHRTKIRNGRNNRNISRNKKRNNTDEMMRIIPGLSEEDQKFLDRVQGSLRTVQGWDDDKNLLEKCRSQIPWKDLVDDYDENSASVEMKYSNYGVDRLLRGSGDSNALFLQRLCRWFPTFMSWVNAPPCKVCGCKDTEMKNVRAPETTEEVEGQAKRVEVYYCPECKDNTTTFPRYNNAEKLLETRKGRCGEYSNLFGLFCRSVGFETRLVLDLSDHLWTEVRLGESWIMADGCEGIIDKPSMYEHGWNKDGLCYMVGIGRDHVVDVTPRYSRQFMKEDFQTRRREHTTSEESSNKIFEKLNVHLRRTMVRSRAEELLRRQKLENAELQHWKQATEWTEQDKYGSGRISGSLAWKQSRQEAGKNQSAESNNVEEESDHSSHNATKSQTREVVGFPVEAFIPPTLANGKINFQVHPHPSSRHDGIIVSNTPCAVGLANSLSVVIVDNDKVLGCILQSKSFVDWSKLVEFVNELPTGRIILMNGKIETRNETKKEKSLYKEVKITRLGGWDGKEVMEKGVIFVGQVDAHPDWTFCKTLEGDNIINGYEIEIETGYEGRKGIPVNRRLRTERAFMPQRIAGRLPDSVMSMSRQVKANEKEKRRAYLEFAGSHAGRYCGYTTKKTSPVYLLDSTSYPLQRIEPVAADVLGKENTWNTFLELSEPLVPNSDCGIDYDPSDTASSPIYDVPLDSVFFNSSLGPNLLSNVSFRKDTAATLSNARLIGLYFSAHWCGPCRQFTPMLAEMYDHLTDIHPTHGIEIVFVSGDRDEQSFKEYYQTMPWKAIPFDQLQLVKQSLNTTYGVRGIPAFVVLDAVSGQVVVSASESRQEVVTACRGGELRIEAMFQSWLGRTPAPTKELLSMLELSTREIQSSTDENLVDPDDNPYLKRIPVTSKQKDDNNSPTDEDISIRIKNEFEKLVNAGHDPNSAAATALTMAAKKTNEKHVTTISPGLFDGKAIYAGKPRSNSKDNVGQALANVLDLNSASAVSGVLNTAFKYLKNSKNEPCEPKYRSFKLSNKIADTVTRVEGGLGLMQALGFEVIGTYQDFKASIPVTADLIAMEKRITQLIEDTGTK